MEADATRSGRRWRRAGRLLAAFVLLLIVAAVTLAWALRASVAPLDGVAEVRGLGHEVTVRFDSTGRAYARAATLEDALFAEGFLHARERLWQMELLRRAGHGRLSELLGGDLLETDRELWRAGVPQLARRLAGQPAPAVATRVQSYVAGVNAGIASLRVPPPEFLLLERRPAPWTAADVYAVGAMISWDSSNNLQNELVRLELRGRLDDDRFAVFATDGSVAGKYPYVIPAGSMDGAAAALASLDSIAKAGLPSAALGSNGWAVAAARSRTGHALFAFDSHDTLSMPTLFYELHLFFGADRQLRGWSLPGLPGVINGFNEYVAWGLTNIGDTQDLFVLPEDARVSSGERVEIPVRGHEQPDVLTVEYTAWGPIVSDRPRLALSWTGHGVGAHGLDALFALNLATDLPSLESAFDEFTLPVGNVTWATRDDHVGFRTIGLLPVRGAGDGRSPLPATPVTAWTGLVPVADLPRRTDPPEGYVAAANARVNAAGQGPLVSADNAPPYRIRRIQSVLSSRSDHDASGMQRLQMDWWNTQAEMLLPSMLPALVDLPEGVQSQAASQLRRWQPRPVNQPDAAAPLIFERWYLALAKSLFADDVGPKLWSTMLKRNYFLNQALDQLVTSEPGSPWWRGRREQLLRDSFRDAVESIAAELGPDVSRWRWEARHEVLMQHELGKAVPLLGRWLDRGPYPWGGGAATVGRANCRYDDPTRVVYGATVRVVSEMHPEGLKLAAVTSAGQSGNPSSPHYADQIEAWLSGRLYPLASRPEDVAGTELRLRPAR